MPNLSDTFPVVLIFSSIEASDPKDRKIEYKLSATKGNFEITQNNNRISFYIPEKLIAPHLGFNFYAYTPESKYNKDFKSMNFTILPNE